MSQPTTSRSTFRIVILEDHVLFAESLELALTVEGYNVRRVTIPREGAVARRADHAGDCGSGRGWRSSTSTSGQFGTARS